MKNELQTTEQKSPEQLIVLAIEKGADPTTLERLLDLQERWEAGNARKAYVLAMTAFKQEAPAVLKKLDRVDFQTTRGRTAYRYANLGSIMQEVTALLGKNELSVSWETHQDDRDNIVVTCHITHSAGHRESVTLRAPADESGNKNRIQAVGSTVTYLQRYTFLSAIGMATLESDDDGHGGSASDGQVTTLRAGQYFREHNTPPIAPPQAKQPFREDDLPPAMKSQRSPASEKQSRAIHTLAGKAGIKEADLLDEINKILIANEVHHQPIGSTKDLTMGQASFLIETLNEMVKQ